MSGSADVSADYRDGESNPYFGHTDIQAVGMFINIEHQGGYSAVTRVLAKTKKPYNLSNVYKAACFRQQEIRLVHIRQDRRKYING